MALCVSPVLIFVCYTALADDKTKDSIAGGPVPSRPRATFEDNPQRGKDPFFPDSKRRLQMIVPVAAASTNTALRPAPVATQLYLKGISGSKAQPLALINNATVAPGENADIRCDGQAIRLRCIEIRDRSVLIEIVSTGEIRELKLREGI
jgi:hypothetical protein